MDAIATIDFEKGLIAPIEFRWKQGLKGNFHPSFEIYNALSGILNPSIEIHHDAPDFHNIIRYSKIWNISTQEHFSGLKIF